MFLRVVSCGRILDISFLAVGGLVGRLAIITSIPAGKFVCRFVGVICVVSSGSSVSQWTVEREHFSDLSYSVLD